MDPAKYEYQSDFAKHYVAVGREEGGRAAMTALIAKLLAMRFGGLPEAVRDRLAAASISELDAIGERLLNAKTLQEALD